MVWQKLCLTRLSGCLDCEDSPLVAEDCLLSGACEGPLSGISLPILVFFYWNEGQQCRVITLTYLTLPKIEKSRLNAFKPAFRGIWLPIVDTYRTICLTPSREVRAVFENAAKFQIS